MFYFRSSLEFFFIYKKKSENQFFAKDLDYQKRLKTESWIKGELKYYEESEEKEEEKKKCCSNGNIEKEDNKKLYL